MDPKDKARLDKAMVDFLLDQEGQRTTGRNPMERRQIVIKGGWGLFKILLLTFCVLFVLKVGQIGGFASASWWTITAPLWGVPGLVLGGIVVFCVVCLIIFGVLYPFDVYVRWKKRRRWAKAEAKRERERQGRMTKPHLPGHPKNPLK